MTIMATEQLTCQPWCFTHVSDKSEPSDPGFCEGKTLRIGNAAFNLFTDGDTPLVWHDFEEGDGQERDVDEILAAAEALVEYLRAVVRVS